MSNIIPFSACSRAIQKMIPVGFHPRFQSPLRARAVAALPVLCLLLATTGLNAAAGDLARYRQFQFGSDVQSVAKLINKAPTDAATLHARPSLIQQLEWRPQALGPSDKTEAVKEVLFTFFEDQLFRVEVSYDHYETEGLTNQDVVAAISDEYGVATTGEPRSPKAADAYGDSGTLIAEWKDATHVFQLLRFDYGPTYKLIGTNSQVEELAGAAITESERLDVEEAPQREAARLARDAKAERTASEASRAVNKPKFRP